MQTAIRVNPERGQGAKTLLAASGRHALKKGTY